MKNRSELREISMKVLYQISILQDTKLPYDTEALIKDQLEIENDFVTSLVTGVIQNQEKLDHLADQYLVDWQISRLNKVDQAILRMGIYELLYTETPSIVAINEAIELSKKYSDEAVTKMINGVLDRIYHDEAHHE